MNGSHFSVFMMSVALTYSAPQRKCISRRPSSYTDDSGRIVVKNNKNTNNVGNNRNNNQGNNKNRGNNDKGGVNYLTLNRLAQLKSETTIRPRKRCCPYDFDSEKCIFVNDRKVCGYDLNSGGPEANPAELTFNAGNGCIFRRGRLECGYIDAPYEGIRRPPVYDRTETPAQDSADDKDITDQTIDDQDYDDKKQRLVYTMHARPRTKTTLPSCVQIRRKIVCNTIKV